MYKLIRHALYKLDLMISITAESLHGAYKIWYSGHVAVVLYVLVIVQHECNMPYIALDDIMPEGRRGHLQ